MTGAGFGSNDVRLSAGQWAVAAILVAAAFWFTPILWERIEPLNPQPDDRIPYRLGDDYWIYSRYARQASQQNDIPVVGDSVIWGHYVSRHETLPAWLNKLGASRRFANLGVDGIHPAAMAGLVDCYGRAIRAKKVLLHCNLLWISSARHDLQTQKEFAFNHPALVPQFFPRIPCYRESFSGRLGITIGRHVPFFGWARHLRVACFDGRDFPAWTIDHPYENPLAAITLELRGPAGPPSPAPDAQPWTARNLAKFGPRWVELDTSLQWASFRRTVAILESRACRVFVLVGPLNEHMLTEESRRTYAKRKHKVEAWLRHEEIPHCMATLLPSELYADASHPLAEGYAALASELVRNESFRRFSETAEAK